ncbi:MAG TPA: hypothetical protein VFY13_02200 [Luteolibacter sp.]|nr:hypothetical protein [Luteolibacter sp.]
MIPRLPLLLSCLLLVPLSLHAQDKPAPEKPKFFEPVKQDIEGWTVWVEPALLDGEHKELGAKSLTMLRNHLQRIAILIPEPQLGKLRKLELWIERHHDLASMQYHPDVDWLQEHGYDPRLTKKVHIPRAEELLSREQMLKHPAVILHELAHSYHDQVLGFEDKGIMAAYDAAMKAGSYEKSLLHTGKIVKHYATTNHKEYFAEATEAYFYRNDFYPFVAAELKIHDPTGYAEMERVWGKLKE